MIENKRKPTEVDRRIGEKIYQIRLLKGISQEGLAKHLAISFQQVQKYENCTNRISASRLWEIAAVLEVPIASFFPNESQDLEDVTKDPEIFKYANMYRSLRQQDKQMIDKLARLLSLETKEAS